MIQNTHIQFKIDLMILLLKITWLTDHCLTLQNEFPICTMLLFSTKPLPLMVIKVPPSELPILGETSEIFGKDFKVT